MNIHSKCWFIETIDNSGKKTFTLFETYIYLKQHIFFKIKIFFERDDVLQWKHIGEMSQAGQNVM